MRVAITYKGGKVFQHFGHSTHFKLYDIENDEVTGAHLVPVQGAGHDALAGFLKMFNVDELICGGIGQGAKDALAANGIKVYGGVDGDVEIVMAQYLAGQLEYDNDHVCDHHDHDGDDHDCGSCCHE